MQEKIASKNILQKINERLMIVKSLKCKKYNSNIISTGSEEHLKHLMVNVLPKVERKQLKKFDKSHLNSFYILYKSFLISKSIRLLDCFNVFYETTEHFIDRKEFIYIYKKALEDYEKN